MWRPKLMLNRHRCSPPLGRRSQGVSLIVVMLILVIVSIMGVAGVQITMMAERGARNDRDYQVAFQAAEAALRDAELEIYGSGTLKSTRAAMFNPATAEVGAFGDVNYVCGTSGNKRGLCSGNLASDDGSVKPAWAQVDFTDTSSTAPTTALGTFTGSTYPAGLLGIQSAQLPRYVIERLVDYSTKPYQYLYRVTAMGFGPRTEIQVVLQTLYRN